MSSYIAAIDQGTTSTRFIVFDKSGRIVSIAQAEHEQIYPRAGWVEHDAEEIWRRTQEVIAEAMRLRRFRPQDLAAIGITNQRETTVVWNRNTGLPYGNAIVWQCRRTAPYNSPPANPLLARPSCINCLSRQWNARIILFAMFRRTFECLTPAVMFRRIRVCARTRSFGFTGPWGSICRKRLSVNVSAPSSTLCSAWGLFSPVSPTPVMLIITGLWVNLPMSAAAAAKGDN